jgi:hypothetical protein
MKVGDLVRIKRSSIGCPRDTVGLIVNIEPDVEHCVGVSVSNSIYKVQTFQVKPRLRRFSEHYLEVINESR